MIDLIRWLRGSSATNIPDAGRGNAGSGFVYVAHDEKGPMASASAGARIGTFTDRPPWIVVDHTLQSPILARWPGRLWRVRILQRASEQPLAYASYTRATAVLIEDELPLAALFDHNGQEVVDLLSSISSLSIQEKDALASVVDESAAKLHNEVWNRWLSQVDASSPYLGQDHTGIIAMGAKPPRSPVGNAPSILHSELTKRARSLDGNGTFVTNDEEQTLNADWLRVASHLQHALFAIGASAEVVSEPEREMLASAYRGATPSCRPRDDA